METIWVMRVVLHLDDGIKVIQETEYETKAEAEREAARHFDENEPRQATVVFPKQK